MPVNATMKAKLSSYFSTGTGRHSRGFTLLEVLIALVVISIGLLGIAAMQALAISNTGIARSRSLAALEASSLSAAMSANPGYWETTTVPTNLTVTGATLSDATLNSQVTNCVASACSTIQMAATDLSNWGSALQQLLGTNGTSGIVACSTTQPISCTITVQWQEKNLQLHQTTSAPQTVTQNYQLFVQP